jgi:hypothetical protein
MAFSKKWVAASYLLRFLHLSAFIAKLYPIAVSQLYPNISRAKIDALRNLLILDLRRTNELVRFGDKNDGGYMLIDDLLPTDTCLSFGIGSNYSFDSEISQYCEKVLMFDHTIQSPILQRKNMFFHPRGISDTRDDLFVTLDDVISDIPVNNDIILKIDVEGAEADDIIGTLVPRHIMNENILIISSDGDFLQLQMYNGRSKYSVKQYNPTQKKFLISENPLEELKQKIINGDKGDGIPNILSPSDTFVREIRQKVMTEAKLTKFMSENYTEYDENSKIGFSRNHTLIDLRNIPDDIQSKIINTYEETVPVKGKLLDYFIANKLFNLMEVIEEF